MKGLNIIFFLCFTIEVFCQDIDQIKKADTVYVLFDKNDIVHQKLKYYDNTDPKMIMNGYHYYFLGETQDINNKPYIWFHEKENTIKIKKELINKKNIIGIDFMLQLGLSETYYLLYPKKNIFILNKRDLKKKSWLKIMKVSILSHSLPPIIE
jgi:hypothetical protein